MRNYKTSVKGKVVLMEYEAISFKPYLDSGGVKTVGAGSTISDIPDLPNWPWNKEISLDEVVMYFERGLPVYERAVNKALNVDVSQELFDALVSLCYNIGTAGLARSSVIKRVNAGASYKSISQAFLMWIKDNGKVVKGLINRRKKEIDLFVNGNYGNGRVGLIVVNSAHKPFYSKSTVDMLTYFKSTIDVLKYYESKDAPAESVEQPVIEKIESKAEPIKTDVEKVEKADKSDEETSKAYVLDTLKYLGNLLLSWISKK